ncbi:VanW family protein [Alkalihalobacterium bogoriense]|uniref:VanW family protein n=1 Tax=Alkalihalobacterium bogoriense TaxID=246272 RepID=UPI00047A7CD3|nr:VanW family protein [Alkalihalobacterium bogoriense]
MNQTKRNNTLKKVYLLFLIQAIILVGLSVSVAPLFGSAQASIPEGSTIGGIQVGGLSEEEALEKLEAEIKEWSEGEALIIETSTGGFYEFQRENFHFQPKTSIKMLNEQTKTSWFHFSKQVEPVHIPLEVQMKNVDEATIHWSSTIKKEETIQQILSQAIQLEENAVQAVYHEGMAEEQVTIATFSIEDIAQGTLSSAANVIANLDGYVIEGQSTFSFLKASDANADTIISSEAISIVASGVYALAIQSNLEINERHQMEEIPDFIQPGLEAEVKKREKDLVIHNSEEVSFTIHIEREDDKLHFSLLGYSPTFYYSFDMENETEIEPRTIYRYDSGLRPNEERLEKNGKDGLRVDVYRVMKNQSGGQVDKVRLAQNFYRPTPKIVAISPKVLEVTVPTSQELEQENETDTDSDSEDQTDRDDSEKEEDADFPIKGEEVITDY